MRPMRLMGLIGLMGLMGLMGCSSDDSEDADEEKRIPIELIGVVTQYDEAIEATRANVTNGGYDVTRGWIPPDGFTLMDTGTLTIGAFMTKNGEAPIEGFFYRSNISSPWHTTLEIENADTYYLYGYIPHTSGVSCEISSTSTPNDNSNYSTGAVLTLNNLPAVTSKDVCVVVGAKNGKNDYEENDDYSVTGLRRGDFAYEALATGTQGNNYVFLLFDHLYSALRVNMRVNGDYNKLRTIILKELYLQPSANGTISKKRLNATITLRANDGTTDPISSIVFTPTGTDEGDGSMLSPTEESVTLTDRYSTYMTHFMPQGVDKLMLTSVYDVYDKQGNLVRPNCKATNTLVLSKLFSEQYVSRRGCRYTVKLTIQPTYLYVLSEPDLDDPTVVMN